MSKGNAVERFLEAACSRDLATAKAIEAEAAPALSQSILAASAAGDAEAVRALLASEPKLATQKGGPRNWEPLLYLSFSGYLRFEAARAQGMVEAARALLSAGADSNAHYFVDPKQESPQTALFGAAGIAGSAELTRLLLEAGADPNDRSESLGPEALYHAAELTDFSCLELLLEHGPAKDKVSYCLARKLDFDDIDGVRLFLRFGADPNFVTPFGLHWTRLHRAIARGRRRDIVELLLDHGADISLRTKDGKTAYALALRLGRTEAADLLRGRGARHDELNETDGFLGACAAADEPRVKAMVAAQPGWISSLTPNDLAVFPQMATENNKAALRVMLDAGFDVETRGEFGTALHHAAWRGNAEAVELLLEHGADVTSQNDFGGTALDAAVFGSTHCHDPEGGMTSAGTPEDVKHGDYPAVVAALLAAGSDVGAVSPFPSGNVAVDTILRRHGAES